MHRAKHIFLDISDGDNNLEPDFPVLVAVAELPAMGEIGPEKVAPQDDENNNNAARNAGKGNTGESIPVVQRPSIKGVLVCTSRQNAPSSSAQSINFPKLVQFMMMHADAENQME